MPTPTKRGHPHCICRTSLRLAAAYCPAMMAVGTPQETSWGRATVSVLGVVGGAYPFGFAGHQVGAHGEGKCIGSVSVALEFYRVRGQGSDPNHTRNSPVLTGPNLSVVPYSVRKSSHRPCSFAAWQAVLQGMLPVGGLVQFQRISEKMAFSGGGVELRSV
jgi:hypothetical protein